MDPGSGAGVTFQRARDDQPLVTPAPEPGSILLMTREARLKTWIPGQARDDISEGPG
jgi:hypothetical protein